MRYAIINEPVNENYEILDLKGTDIVYVSGEELQDIERYIPVIKNEALAGSNDLSILYSKQIGCYVIEIPYGYKHGVGVENVSYRITGNPEDSNECVITAEVIESIFIDYGCNVSFPNLKYITGFTCEKADRSAYMSYNAEYVFPDYTVAIDSIRVSCACGDNTYRSLIGGNIICSYMLYLDIVCPDDSNEIDVFHIKCSVATSLILHSSEYIISIENLRVNVKDSVSGSISFSLKKVDVNSVYLDNVFTNPSGGYFNEKAQKDIVDSIYTEFRNAVRSVYVQADGCRLNMKKNSTISRFGNKYIRVV